MAFDTKVRMLWAVLAIPGVLLGIGASYEHGGLTGLRDITLDMLESVGFYRQAPPGDTSISRPLDPGVAKPSALLPADEVFWLTIKDSRAKALFGEFLKKFPNSPHAQEAQAKLDQLQKASQTMALQPEMSMQGPSQKPMMPPGNPPNGQ